jgi:hypothetical protein
MASGFSRWSKTLLNVGTLGDTTSHAYNAELVKQLSPAMQTKIAGYGAPLGQLVH